MIKQSLIDELDNLKDNKQLLFEKDDVENELFKVDEIKSSLTSDLFGIEPCPNCDGSGQIESIEDDRIEDCDICNGGN